MTAVDVRTRGSEPRTPRLQSPRVAVPADDLRWLPHLTASTSAVRSLPPMLDPRRLAHEVRDRGGEFDVLHVADETLRDRRDELEDVAAAVRGGATRLVVTVRHIDDPYAGHAREHLDRLNLVIPAADAVVTYSDAAAEVLDHHYGRDVVVIEAPPLLLDRELPTHERTDEFVVGAAVDDLPPSIDVRDVVVAIRAALPDQVADRVSIRIEPAVLDPAHPRHDGEVISWLREHEADGLVELVTDEDPAAWLTRIDTLVLAHRRGSHDPWHDAARQVGVPVVSPAVGFVREERLTVVLDQPLLTADALEPHLAVLRDQRPRWQPSPRMRQTHLAHVKAAHQQLYHQVVAVPVD